MNISTYESRIKALEDQLNPPAPGGSTGLLSVTVSPDITLSDGTSLNAKLAELMPMTSGSKTVTYNTTADQIPVTTTFNVEVVPGSEWYALKGIDEQDHPIFGEKGETNNVTFTPYSEGNRELILHVNASAAATTETSDPSFQPVYINIKISAPLL